MLRICGSTARSLAFTAASLKTDQAAIAEAMREKDFQQLSEQIL
jgi:hypothetical protein